MSLLWLIFSCFPVVCKALELHGPSQVALGNVLTLTWDHDGTDPPQVLFNGFKYPSIWPSVLGKEDVTKNQFIYSVPDQENIEGTWSIYAVNAQFPFQSVGSVTVQVVSEQGSTTGASPTNESPSTSPASPPHSPSPNTASSGNGKGQSDPDSRPQASTASDTAPPGRSTDLISGATILTATSDAGLTSSARATDVTPTANAHAGQSYQPSGKNYSPSITTTTTSSTASTTIASTPRPPSRIAIILGAILGVLVFLLLIFILAFLFRRFQRKRRAEATRFNAERMFDPASRTAPPNAMFTGLDPPPEPRRRQPEFDDNATLPAYSAESHEDKEYSYEQEKPTGYLNNNRYSEAYTAVTSTESEATTLTSAPPTRGYQGPMIITTSPTPPQSVYRG